MRERQRAEIRASDATLSQWTRAEALDKCSERGPACVGSLHAVTRVNRPDPADDAFLGDGPTIFPMPVGEGVV